MTALELKPCPFCGNAAAEPWFDDDAERAEVYCTKCSGTATSGYVSWLCDDADRKEAISAAVTAWNTRADIADAAVAAAYEAAAVEMDLGAHVVSNCGIDEETQAYTNAARIIRALTPDDAKAALEAVRREARAEALREAAQELSDCGEHQAVPCILALIDKETTE